MEAVFYCTRGAGKKKIVYTINIKILYSHYQKNIT
jgi:hypothetical protein